MPLQTTDIDLTLGSCLVSITKHCFIVTTDTINFYEQYNQCVKLIDVIVCSRRVLQGICGQKYTALIKDLATSFSSAVCKK